MINRVVNAFVGGAVVFIAMSLLVVTPLKTRVAELKVELDTSANGASRLLDEAKAQMEGKNYSQATQILTALDQSHPTSAEAEVGRALAIQVSAAQIKDDAEWTKAAIKMRGAWVVAETARLRSDLEKDILVKVEQNWTDAQDRLRDEWEK